MPKSGLEIISLERIKTELRFTEGDDAHDQYLKDLIESAASYIAADLDVPLIDKVVYFDGEFPDGARPIVIEDKFARGLDGIRYNSQNNIGGFFPTLLPSERYNVAEPRVDDYLEGMIVASPTGGGWGLTGRFRALYTRGIVDVPRYQTLMVLMIRANYNGENMSSESSAYNRIASKLRQELSNPAGYTGSRV